MVCMSLSSPSPAQAAASPCNPAAPAPTNADPGSVVLADNFETNDFSKWTTVTHLGDATAAVQSAIFNSPACAARISVTGNSGSEANVVKNLPAPAREVWASGWFDITREGSASNNNVPTLRFFNGSQRVLDVSRQNISGDLFVRWPTGSGFTIIGVGHLAVGQKFALKIHLVLNGTQSQAQVWQDGTKLFDRSNSTTGFIDLGSNTSINVLQLGAEHVMQDGDMIADDIILKTVVPGQAAPVFTAASPPSTATAGNPYSYTFSASGTPAPTFGVSSGALPAGLSLNTATGVLSGTPTTAGSSTFAVTATNGVSPDAVTGSLSITVNSAPAAPTGVTATAGDASATVAWTAPANGGSAITSYTVTPHTGTTTLTPVTIAGTPPATGATITGLTNGTAYTFTVTATNAVGTSPASAASNSVTPAGTTGGTTITNGGFESGLTAWTTSGVRAPVASTTAHTGTRSALLGLASGTEPSGNSSLSQTITVPATGTSTLSFWYQPHTTDETCTGTACRYDWMEAQIRSTTGAVLGSIFKLCNNKGTWTQVTTDLTAYKGQTITLWFNTHLDGASPADDTWMYLDDATLTNTP